MTPTCKLFQGLPQEGISWMSHGDYMAKVPEGFSLVAHTDACPNVAICDESRGFYGVQYHPEVNHTENGVKMIRNFLYEVCHANGRLDHGRLLQDRHCFHPGEGGRAARCCWPCPAAWIPPLQRRCWPRQWAVSSPACSWITA